MNTCNVEELENAIKSVQYPNTISIMKYTLLNTGIENLLYIENIHPLGSAYLFSSKLKEAILNEGCTGIEFESL